MTIMRPPQHGQGCSIGLGSVASTQLSYPASGCAAGTSSRRRARAMLSARVPLASRPFLQQEFARVMSLHCTNRTNGDVLCTSAVEGQAEVTQMVDFGSD